MTIGFWQAINRRPVARGGGGRGGRTTPPPQLPIPKILFHPLAILFHLSAILFHPLAILFHPSAILFHPLAILFHPWNMWMTSHGQCPRGGGVLVNVQEWGAFFKLMTSRGECPRGGCLWMSKGGGCAWCSTHPSSDPPPHLAGWLRAWTVNTYIYGFSPYYVSPRRGIRFVFDPVSDLSLSLSLSQSVISYLLFGITRPLLERE